ncbi:MAG: hypothetical protein MRY59_06245 [Aquisalinus sp.]|nr:hypothetical protein [Aquisalinus sp.]
MSETGGNGAVGRAGQSAVAVNDRQTSAQTLDALGRTGSLADIRDFISRNPASKTKVTRALVDHGRLATIRDLVAPEVTGQGTPARGQHASWVSRQLAYGNWSGPDYTAGFYSSDVEGPLGRPVSRALAQERRALAGVDPYDNFVAKAHDINEFDAERELRVSLNRIDERLASTDVGFDAYGRPFFEGQLPSGDQSLWDFRAETRFVSYQGLMKRADELGLSSGQRRALGGAMINYFEHVSRSNLQYVMDSRTHETDSTWASAQRLFARGIFAGEADKTMRMIGHIRDDLGADIYDTGAVQAYLRENFVTPQGEDFVSLGRGGFQQTLTREQIISASYLELRRAAGLEDPADFNQLVTSP